MPSWPRKALLWGSGAGTTRGLYGGESRSLLKYGTTLTRRARAKIFLFVHVGFQGKIECRERSRRGGLDELLNLCPDGIANLPGPGQPLFP